MRNSRAEERASQTCCLWIVNHYADAPDQPAGTRHFDLARRLTTEGWRVTIFAAGFSHVTGREERLGRGRLYRSQYFNGVRFVWIRTIPYRGNTWRRQLNMLSYLLVFLLVQTRFAAPDTIIGSTVHPFAALGAWLVSRVRSARFLFEIRDLWPQTLVDLGALRDGSPGERLLRTIEAFLVSHALFVVALLPGVRDYLRQRGLPIDHVVYLPNGVDLEAFDALALDTVALEVGLPAFEAIQKLRGQGRFVLGYVGAFGRVNDLGVVIRAARMADERRPGRIGLVLVGDGPERPALERLAALAGPVELSPAVPKRSVPAVLQALDATVVHAKATPVYRYGISFNKLFEYMAAARPVVFACSSAYDPVRSSEAGITAEPDDPQALADAFLQIADAGPDARAKMGAAGRAYVAAEHDIARLTGMLADLVACG